MPDVCQDWATEYKGESRKAQPNEVKVQYYKKDGTPGSVYTLYCNNGEIRNRFGHTSNKVSPGGWKPCTTYHRSVRRVRVFPGSYDCYDKMGKKVITVTGAPPSIADGDGALPGSQMRVNQDNFYPQPGGFDSAAVEMLEKFKDGKADLGTALGGSLQAFDGLVGTFKRSVDFLLAVKRGNLGRAADIFLDVRNNKKLAEDWLKFQYHWRPLASDVWDAYNLVGAKFQQPGQHLSAYGSTRTHAGGRPVRYNPNGSVRGFEVWRGFVTHRYKCWATVDPAAMRAATQTGLTNPLAVAWDLLPWSFAVDWLIPVGRTIGIMDAVKGLTFKDGYSSLSGQMVCTGEYSSDWGTGSTPTGGIKYQVLKSYYHRSKLSGFPKPLPWVKNPFSSEHAANALALFTVLRKR